MTNKEALEILTHNWTKLVNPDCTDKELGQAQDLAIKALKERPHGKWISKDKVDGHMFGYSCSNCRNPEWQITRFCPNCGAKMDGGADDDK